jgi:protein-S-isoprenylcysteine O-methyltransferase Ste14
MPVDFGILFYIGLSISVLGMIIGGLALYSFAHSSGLTTTRIHCYSRNPIYVGWSFFILGLTIICWSDSMWRIIFALYLVITIPYLHWTVLLEEAFLVNKYGDSYRTYLEKTPRYLGRTKTHGV